MAQVGGRLLRTSESCGDIAIRINEVPRMGRPLHAVAAAGPKEVGRAKGIDEEFKNTREGMELNICGRDGARPSRIAELGRVALSRDRRGRAASAL